MDPTNALPEGMNGRIQELKRRACGYRNRERFRNAIASTKRTDLGYNEGMTSHHHELLPVSLASNSVIEAYKQHIDRSLLRENLRLTTAERVEKMLSALRFAEQVRASRVQHPAPSE